MKNPWRLVENQGYYYSVWALGINNSVGLNVYRINPLQFWGFFFAKVGIIFAIMSILLSFLVKN
jgi:hypothetical protein